MRRLICTFVVCIWHEQVLSWMEQNQMNYSVTCIKCYHILFQRELLALSLELSPLISKDCHFERLVVSESVAMEMFEDNRFKMDQIPAIAGSSEEAGKVTIYRVGDHIDISRGPLISTTGQIGRFAITTVSYKFMSTGWRKSVVFMFREKLGKTLPNDMSHIVRKPILCEQQRRRSACASAHSDQHLCCSLPR